MRKSRRKTRLLAAALITPNPGGKHYKEMARHFQPGEIDFLARQEVTARCQAHAGCLEERGEQETGVYTKHGMMKPGSNWEPWKQKGRKEWI